MNEGRKNRRSSIIAGMIMLGIICAGCATSLTREGLLSKMSSGDNLLVIDVRSQAEYDRDHLPGAVHIPFYSIRSGLGEIGREKNEPVVLYCEHGPRAGIAALTLSFSGYKSIYSLEGHMNGWRKNAFPVEVISHGTSSY